MRRSCGAEPITYRLSLPGLLLKQVAGDSGKEPDARILRGETLYLAWALQRVCLPASRLAVGYDAYLAAVDGRLQEVLDVVKYFFLRAACFKYVIEKIGRIVVLNDAVGSAAVLDLRHRDRDSAHFRGRWLDPAENAQIAPQLLYLVVHGTSDLLRQAKLALQELQLLRDRQIIFFLPLHQLLQEFGLVLVKVCPVLHLLALQVHVFLPQAFDAVLLFLQLRGVFRDLFLQLRDILIVQFLRLHQFHAVRVVQRILRLRLGGT